MEEQHILFDMDGVLIDSITPLYEAYEQFLGARGKKATQEEFDLLNGPSLQEIVAYLKKKHGLEEDEQALFDDYDARMEASYKAVKAMPGAKETLEFFKKKGLTMTLASSATKQDITTMLTKIECLDYFDHIISGDDVEHSKPNPAIYLKAKEGKQGRFFVIEDAPHGLAAAKAAGYTAIYFNPERIVIDQEHDLEIAGLTDLKRVFAADIPLGKSLRIRIEGKYEPDEEIKKAADDLWEKQVGNFNGELIVYRDYTFEDGDTVIISQRSQYKYVYANIKGVNQPMKPLGVSGIIIDKQGKTLFGVRSGVAHHNGWHELIPSGNMNEEHIQGGAYDYEGQLLEEFHEETNIKEKPRTELVGLVYDEEDDMLDVCMALRIERFPNDLAVSEYKEFSIEPTTKEYEKIVCTSRNLLNVWNRDHS